MLRARGFSAGFLIAVSLLPCFVAATDCLKKPDLLENCDQWKQCVNSSGTRCPDGNGGLGNNLVLQPSGEPGDDPPDYVPPISGTIPDNIKLLTGLKSIDLSSNLISGTIPSCISKLTSLLSMIFAGNKISGTIPEAIGLLTGLHAMNFAGQENDPPTITMKISGTIPSSFSKLTSLTSLELGGNFLEGASAGICVIVGNFTGANHPCNLLQFQSETGYPPLSWDSARCPACLSIEDGHGQYSCQTQPDRPCTGGDSTPTPTPAPTAIPTPITMAPTLAPTVQVTVPASVTAEMARLETEIVKMTTTTELVSIGALLLAVLSLCVSSLLVVYIWRLRRHAQAAKPNPLADNLFANEGV